MGVNLSPLVREARIPNSKRFFPSKGCKAQQDHSQLLFFSHFQEFFIGEGEDHVIKGVGDWQRKLRCIRKDKLRTSILLFQQAWRYRYLRVRTTCILKKSGLYRRYKVLEKAKDVSQARI